jgi:hypothetical protein
MKINFKGILIVAVALIWLASCKQQGPSSGFMEMEFEVDKTLLAEEPVIDSALGFAFYTPRYWTKTDIGSLHLPDEELHEHGLVPKYLFMHPVDSSSMLVAALKNFSNEQLAMMRVDFYNIFNSQGIWIDVQHATFSFNNLNADQFLMFNDELINFKLFLSAQKDSPGAERISVDYIIPRTHYEENIKSVESSIGSLVLFNQK